MLVHQFQSIYFSVCELQYIICKENGHKDFLKIAGFKASLIIHNTLTMFAGTIIGSFTIHLHMLIASCACWSYLHTVTPFSLCYARGLSAICSIDHLLVQSNWSSQQYNLQQATGSPLAASLCFSLLMAHLSLQHLVAAIILVSMFH